jgi:hypothetical protein
MEARPLLAEQHRPTQRQRYRQRHDQQHMKQQNESNTGNDQVKYAL